MTSYLPATELNTARTRSAFSAERHLFEPEIDRGVGHVIALLAVRRIVADWAPRP